MCMRTEHGRKKETHRQRIRSNQTLDRTEASLLIRTTNVCFPLSCTLITRVEIDGFATDTVKRFQLYVVRSMEIRDPFPTSSFSTSLPPTRRLFLFRFCDSQHPPPPLPLRKPPNTGDVIQCASHAIYLRDRSLIKEKPPPRLMDTPVNRAPAYCCPY